MKFKRVLALSCAALLLSSYAHAQNNTIVVTATRTQTEILKTPSPVNVITQKQMQKQGTIFVKDALKYVPGVSVISNGAFGGKTSVYMMGLPNKYIKTLIDGIDVSDPSQPQPYYDFTNLLPDGINRIEIVQGAQSGLYGANAVGGVINIITKKGEGKPYAKYTQEFGSYNTYKESAETGGKIHNVSLYFSTLRLDTGGISKMDKYNPQDHSYSRGDEKDSYYQTALNTRLEYYFDDSMNIGTVLMWSKTRDYLDDSGWGNPNDNSPSNKTPTAKSLRQINHFLLSKMYLNKSFNNLKIRLNIYYTQTFRYFKPSSIGWKDYKGKRWGSNLIAVYSLNKTKITVGFSQKMDKYEDTTPFKKLRYNYAGFGEILQSIGNLNLQATSREDDFKTFGKHFTYKLGANYLLPQTQTILKANFGTGFRAPSIFEMYAPGWGISNTNLKPEKSKSWNLGLTQFFKYKTSINLLLFKNIINNLINYDFTKNWKIVYYNAKGKTISDGFEIGLKSNPTEFLTVGANYTYTASKDSSTGEQAARIPLRVYTGYITVKPLGDKLTATLDGRYIGKRYDDSGHKHQTGKYAVFDFTLLYKPIKNLEASLTVKNIFDRFYEEVYGYSTLPRSVFATVSYKF